jgi:GTP cyclohydrolase I
MKKTELISQQILERILKDKGRYFADDNISQYIHEEDELKQLQLEVEEKVEALLNSLIIDTKNDPHARETSHRMAKMLLFEVMQGRYQPLPRMKSFDVHQPCHDLFYTWPYQHSKHV